MSYTIYSYVLHVSRHWYCSEDHQKKHWTKHQEVCNPMVNPGIESTRLMVPSGNNMHQQECLVAGVSPGSQPMYSGSGGVNNNNARNTMGFGVDSSIHKAYNSAPSQQLFGPSFIYPTASATATLNLTTTTTSPVEKSLKVQLPIGTKCDSTSTRDVSRGGNSYPAISNTSMYQFSSREQPNKFPVTDPSIVVKRSIYSTPTPSFLSPKIMRIVEDRNSQSKSSADSDTAEDTGRFSDKIRRSSSFPLNPIPALFDNESGPDTDVQCGNQPMNNSQTDLNSADSLLQKTKPHARTFQQKSVGPAIGDLHLGAGSSLANYITHWMQKYGICVLDNFLSGKHSDHILAEMKSLYADGQFAAGQLLKGTGEAEASDIRGDLIAWADGTEPSCTSIGHLISTLDAVVIACQSNLADCRISGRTKAMLACYPGNGTRYLKHVDNPGGDGRKITCIYYLNKNWNSREDGGLLRIYPAGQDIVANIEPLFNRLLLFWSDRRNPHEVFPAYSTRFAVTVWYFDLLERGRAKIKTQE